MQTLWQVEQNPYCLAVLAKHFPDARRFEDVCEVGSHNLEPVDLICGGFPCQDLSSAGKGAGLDGERSGLWAEFARIIRELRPRYVVVENVPDLLAGRGKRWPVAPISRVLGDLSECGYDAEWSVLSAAEFGAPHLRERVWIVAYPHSDGRDLGDSGPQRHEGAPRPGAGDVGQLGSVGGGDAGRGSRASHGATGGARNEAIDLANASRDAEEGAEAQARAERERAGQGSQRGGARGIPDTDSAGCPQQRRAESVQAQLPSSQCGSEALADPDGLAGPESSPCEGQRGEVPRSGSLQRAIGRSGCERHPWESEPDVGRVADGIPFGVDRLSALGNALVPQIAEWIGQRILDYEEGGVGA